MWPPAAMKRFKAPVGRRFAQFTSWFIRCLCVHNICLQTFCARCIMFYKVTVRPKHLPTDVVRKLQHVLMMCLCIQNTCRQACCTIYTVLPQCLQVVCVAGRLGSRPKALQHAFETYMAAILGLFAKRQFLIHP